MARLVAVLDANVLHPARPRDLLLRLAIAGTFQPRWTATILAECVGSIAADRPDLTAEQLDRTRHLMGVAVPDALVEGYEDLIDQLELPDPDDRHVLAAAMAAGADLLVTWNLADFQGGLEASGRGWSQGRRRGARPAHLTGVSAPARPSPPGWPTSEPADHI